MARFFLLTCWLIGAGGGWGLGLAGLNAMGAGGGGFAELILLGGASSWAAMLVTAFRPGKRPNLWQRVFTGLAWFMPLGMFMLGDAFNLNVRIFSVLAAACVTMIVVIYPSQSPQPRLDEGRRLAMHMREQEAKQKRAQEKTPEPESPGTPGMAGVPGHTPVGAQSSAPVQATQTSAAEPAAVPSVPRPDWAPRAEPPSAPSRSTSPEDSSSRWEAPRVRRRGTLGEARDADEPTRRRSPEGDSR